MPRVQTPAHLRREYECIYLLDQDIDEPSVDKQISHYRNLVGEQGGKILRIDNWGLRRLAYEIKKKPRATYIYMQYLAEGKVVAEIERTMRLSEDVVRYMTIVIDDNVDPEARPSSDKVTKHEVVEERIDPRRDRTPRATAPTPMSPVQEPRDDDHDDHDDDGRRDRPRRTSSSSAPAAAAKPAAAAPAEAAAPAADETPNSPNTTEEE